MKTKIFFAVLVLQIVLNVACTSRLNIDGWFKSSGTSGSLAVPINSPDLPPSGASIVPTGQTWYVRTDGGTATQCDGRGDASYAGTGTNQHCAFSNPYYLWGNDTVYGETPTWKIAGGDTVIFRGGPYRMGYKGPNPGDSWAQCPGDAFGCTMPSIPSGTASVHTKLLGENFANCSTKTQLFGGYGLNHIITLNGSQHVDVACLELTDHAQCTRTGVGTAISPSCSSSTPLDDYAGAGMTTDTQTSDINLIDLNIHGLTSRGIIGPVGAQINVNHVRVAYNGGAGWDFDDGAGTPSAANASVNAQSLVVQWNGCNEEYPIVDSYPAISCYDQNDGGYGDGVGTPGTTLNFACDHCQFDHNTQDGLDLLHTNGSAIVVTNSLSFANMGQQFKMGAMASVVFQNDIAIHNCNRMSAPIAGANPNFNSGLSLFCRAAGDGYALALSPTSKYVLQNNTYVGYGSTSYDIGCSTNDCSTASFIYQNNLNMAYANPFDGQLPGLFYYEAGVSDSIWTARDHNIYYNFRHGCPTGFSNETCVDPQFTGEPTYNSEADLDGLVLTLQPGSPALNSGVSIPGLLLDFGGNTRKTPPDIGAY